MSKTTSVHHFLITNHHQQLTSPAFITNFLHQLLHQAPCARQIGEKGSTDTTASNIEDHHV